VIKPAIKGRNFSPHYQYFDLPGLKNIKITWHILDFVASFCSIALLHKVDIYPE